MFNACLKPFLVKNDHNEIITSNMVPKNHGRPDPWTKILPGQGEMIKFQHLSHPTTQLHLIDQKKLRIKIYLLISIEMETCIIPKVKKVDKS